MTSVGTVSHWRILSCALDGAVPDCPCCHHDFIFLEWLCAAGERGRRRSRCARPHVGAICVDSAIRSGHVTAAYFALRWLYPVFQDAVGDSTCLVQVLDAGRQF